MTPSGVEGGAEEESCVADRIGRVLGDVVVVAKAEGFIEERG